MRPGRGALVVALLLATTLYGRGSEAAGALPPVAHGQRILAFGDSLTFGIGGGGESYPARLSQLAGVEVVNDGIPGETAPQGAARFAASLDAVKPALAIVCLGINDFFKLVPREDTRRALRSLIDTAQQRHVPLLLLAIPQPGQARADSGFDEVASATGTALDATAMAPVLHNPALKADLVHPNRAGYRQIAETLHDRLVELGALRR